MTNAIQGATYRDSDGRLFRLVERVDPRGDTPPYWKSQTVNADGQPIGHQSTIREDRILAGEYDAVDQ